MKTIVPIDIITLGEDNSYHLLTSGSINGVNYFFLIDTGASHTIFDSTLVPQVDETDSIYKEIQSAGIQSGELKSSIGRIKKFKIGQLKLTEWTVVLIDLSHINSLYKKFTNKSIAGLLGGDFLLKHQAIIDYKKKKLVLRKT